MCGRVNVSDHEGVRALLAMMGMNVWPSRDPRFNIAPTQTLDVVQLDQGEPVLRPMSWGVSMNTKGAKGQSIVKRIPNSRDDKVWSSYLWRYLIPDQRVLVPVNGFYEWKRANKKLVQAWCRHITLPRRQAMPCFLPEYSRHLPTIWARPTAWITTMAQNFRSSPPPLMRR